MADEEKLYLTISKGAHGASARPIIVSSDQELVRNVAPIVAKSIGLDPARVSARLDDAIRSTGSRVSRKRASSTRARHLSWPPASSRHGSSSASTRKRSP